MAPLVAQRRLIISACAPAVRCLNRSLLYCVWRLPFLLDTMHAHAAHFSLPTGFQLPHLGRSLSQPQSCFGLSTRDDVSSLWLRGATAPCLFII